MEERQCHHIREVLTKSGLEGLCEQFISEHISLDVICQLSDAELSRLGVKTIGQRANLRKTVRDQSREHEREANSNLPSTNSSTRSAREIANERATLFSSYGQRSRSQAPNSRGSRSGGRRNFKDREFSLKWLCLASKEQTRIPTPSEKEILNNAGLGKKIIKLCKSDSPEDVQKKLMSEILDENGEPKGFPKLKDAGGFELMRSTQSCRDLKYIECLWSAESLQKNVNCQTCIYIRPVQNDLNVDPIHVPSNENNHMLTPCNNCKKKFPVRVLREHVEHCDITVEDQDSSGSEFLPELNISSITHATAADLHSGRSNNSASLDIGETEDFDAIQSVTDTTSEDISILAPLPNLDVMSVEETLDTVSNTYIKDSVISDIVESSSKYCMQNNISNPVEIIRLFQQKIVTGRQLDVEDDSVFLEGDTNHILIDRDRVVESALEEIAAIDDLRICLEVQFYGEVSVDLGGPRKEFFVLVLNELKEKYFDPVREWSGEYQTIGKIMALSLLQNGKLPRLLSSELVEEVFNDKENGKRFILEIRKGLDALGVYTLASKLPTLVHVFTPGASTPLTVKKLTNILSPIFSDNGSNKRRLEAAVYAKFVKYLREVASGRRGDVTLNSILQFVTGADEEPMLGFQINPTIHFVYTGVSFLPTSNTCINKLTLGIPEKMEQLPDDDIIHGMFDYAFCNTYFGLK